MKNAKHTPGPWSVNDWPQGDAEIRIGAPGTPRIATVHLRDVSINEQKANAHLIAAAPELLEAIRDLLVFGRDTENGAPSKRAEVALSDARVLRDRIDATFAKAEGAA